MHSKQHIEGLLTLHLIHKELRSQARAFAFSGFLRMLIYIIIKTKFKI